MSEHTHPGAVTATGFRSSAPSREDTATTPAVLVHGRDTRELT